MRVHVTTVFVHHAWDADYSDQWWTSLIIIISSSSSNNIIGQRLFLRSESAPSSTRR